MHFVHNTWSAEVTVVMCFLCHAHWFALARAQGPRPWGQDKGVCHFLRQEKKKQWNIHSLSLALTLTLTAILSPNHYTTSNFGRPCTQFRLMCIAHANQWAWHRKAHASQWAWHRKHMTIITSVLEVLWTKCTPSPTTWENSKLKTKRHVSGTADKEIQLFVDSVCIFWLLVKMFVLQIILKFWRFKLASFVPSCVPMRIVQGKVAMTEKLQFKCINSFLYKTINRIPYSLHTTTQAHILEC